MPNYIYDDSPIEIGDVVEMQEDWSIHNQPKGTLSIVIAMDITSPCIADKRSTCNAYSSHYVKKIKTKPGSKSIIGDIVLTK